LADLWVVLYFADILAVIVMFVPYLRTFWRMKTIPLGGPALPLARAWAKDQAPQQPRLLGHGRIGCVVAAKRLQFLSRCGSDCQTECERSQPFNRERGNPLFVRARARAYPVLHYGLPDVLDGFAWKQFGARYCAWCIPYDASGERGHPAEAADLAHGNICARCAGRVRTKFWIRVGQV